jgi:hypothetical protein
MSAAISGLLAAGAAACGDEGEDETQQPQSALDDEELSALCADEVDDALEEAKKDQDVESLCSDMVEAAKNEATEPAICPESQTAAAAAPVEAEAECPEPDLAMACSELVQSEADKCLPLTGTSDQKTTSSEQKEYKYAELTKRCDERGGYVQIHAACGSVNTCQGFSFGDWGPDGALVTEHSCSGVNGCNGLSCIVLPKDSGKTGQEIYAMEFTEPGPGACTNCHAEHTEAGDTDASKFKVWVFPGSTRTVENWTQRSAAEQERVVAFGAHGVTANGLAYQNMSAYNKVLSRAEIERVVAHLRTLTPEMHEVKLVDPTAPATPAP